MILITGGAGYIGSHSNKLFASAGRETVVFDNLSYGHESLVRYGKFVRGDLCDAAAVDNLFSDNNIDAVIHFAGLTYVGESVSDPAKYYFNNVSGTVNLLGSMVKHGVQNIVFSSSCAVYGLPERLPISESLPKQPISPYGMTKLVAEEMLAHYSAAYGIRYTALRYFNAAGADSDGELGEWHDPETHLMPLVMDAACGFRPSVKIFGTDYPTPDGTCVRDYIHVEDLAEAHLLALDHLKSGGVGGCFNIGAENGYSVREVIEAVKRVSGRKITVVKEDRRAGDPPVLVADASLAAGTLGFRPKRSDLDTMVSDAWNWHMKMRNIKK